MSWWRTKGPIDEGIAGTFAEDRERIAEAKARAIAQQETRSRRLGRRERVEYRYSDDQPRDSSGKFEGSGSDPESEIKQMAAGENVNLEPSAIGGVLKQETADGTVIDLEHLGVGGTYIFHGDSGIGRADMPQIPDDQRGAFIDALKEQGFDTHTETVPVDSLHPTQNEINGEKATGIAQAITTGKFDVMKEPLFSTKDGHILDGHHRWAAQEVRQFETGKPQYINTTVIDASIGDVLKVANGFDTAHGVEHAGFATGPTDVTAGL